MGKLEPPALLRHCLHKLLQQETFFGSVLASREFIEVENIPTFCTDGVHIFWNRKFVEGPLAQKGDEEQKKFIKWTLIHEVAHIYKRHMQRLKHRKLMKWNKACDHIINLELQAEAIFNASSEIAAPEHIGLCNDPKYQGWHEERVYDDLKDPPGGDGDCGGGVGDFLPIPQGMDEGAVTAEIETIISAAVQRAKQAGKLPGGLEKLVGDLNKSKLPFSEILRPFIDPFLTTEMCWSQIHKRTYGSTRLYLPDYLRDGIGEIVIAVDTSGSNEHEIPQCLSEVVHCVHNFRIRATHVMLFDTSVYHYEVVDHADASVFEMRRARVGGTHFQAVWDKIEQEGIKPRVLLMLTDGYDTIPPKPDYPVVWCMNTDVTPPYGKVVRF